VGTTTASVHNIAAELVPLAFPIALLDELPGNPRTGDDAAVAASYAEFGQLKPLVAVRQGRSKRGTVHAGNTQLRAARDRLGWTEIAVVWLAADDERAKAFALIDNRSHDLGVYDSERLLAMIDAITEEELRSVIGYSLDDVADLRASLVPVSLELPSDELPPPPPPTTRLGDTWLLGAHRLACGDATIDADVDALMAGSFAELVFTDPPYGVGYDGGTKKRQQMSGDHSTDLYEPAVRQAHRASVRDAPLYLWHSGGHSGPVTTALDGAGWVVRVQLVWLKNEAQNGALNAHYKGKHETAFYAVKRGQRARWCGPTNEVTVWEHDRPHANDLHPTQKPVALATRALRNHRCTTVLDLFGGSGSTMMAAEHLGRAAYTLEIDPRYCDTMALRWQLHTGQLPVLEATGTPVDLAAAAAASTTAPAAVT
jgi:site-specific DNA-methyltransferase (adenine-specific)